jgi:hypothetical protein
MTTIDAGEAVPMTVSAVNWPAILAGAVLSTAVALILLAFGTALGLAVTSPFEGEGVRPVWFVIGVGLWLVWVQLISSYVGGYVTARLRPRAVGQTEHEVDVRDGLHGLLMWATTVIAAAIISTAGIGGATSAARTAESPRDLAAAAAAATQEEIDRAAVQEARTNPEAADESVTERRADLTRKLGIIAAFVSAAALLLGAAAAFYAALAGGRHRDRSVTVPFFVVPR